MGKKTDNGEDISGDKYKIMKAAFLDMRKRRKAYVQEHNKEPAFVRLPVPNQNGYVTIERMEEMEKRYDAYKREHGHEPAYIVVYPAPDMQNSGGTPDGWVTTGFFKGDYQDTSYTCGPSSCQMMLSALGLSIGEKTIASVAHSTPGYGTSQSNLFAAIRKLAPDIKIKSHSLSEMPYESIAGKLKEGKEFILDINTTPLYYDAYGNRVWMHSYFHYIYLVGVNVNKQLVRVFDPTKGNKDFKWHQMTNAIKAYNGPSVLMFGK